jgi:hypothetical protein
MATDAAGNIYVSNQDEHTIVVFAAGANGNAAPTRTISGSLTGLHRPMGLAFDALDRLYVVNLGVYNSCCQSIMVYPAGVHGNAAPLRTIAGSTTALVNPLGITVDDAGNIYVSNFGNTDSGPSNSQTTILKFTPAQSGNVPPTTMILGENQLSEPLGVAVDVTGKLFAANFFGNTLSIYAAGANGAVAPSATISGAATGLNRPSYITF